MKQTLQRPVIGTWGLFGWFPGHAPDLIHPDDLANVQVNWPAGQVCSVIGQDGDYLKIRYGVHEFRGKPEYFQPVDPPAFALGQKVKTTSPRTPKTGIVRAIGWHFKTGKPSYYLEVNGKALKSRYWAHELEGA